MNIIDFIVNLAALLLWLNFRALGFDPLVRTSASSLVATLRRAEPRRGKRWAYIASLLGVLLFRGWFYHQIGPAVDWMPAISLGPIGITFRSDYQDRMFLFSLVSFLGTLGFFYLSALFISILNGNSNSAEGEPVQRIVRLHLGFIDRWPLTLRWLLPFLATLVLWLGCEPFLGWLRLVPPASGFAHRLEQGVLLGVAVYLPWRYLAGAILALYMLNSYVYLGSHAFWGFISNSGRSLLKPLRRFPLTLGVVDLAPFVAMVLIFPLAELLVWFLPRLYSRLPF
jgi:uncharacterized protein YggT (Ycf19 family)